MNILKNRRHLTLLGVLLAVIGVYFVYIYGASPAVIRNPKYEHFHFRMQVIVDGKKEDFASSKYQAPSLANACAADLTGEPIHFHDKKDQIVHIHWSGMTGGLVLKYYGWNRIGGLDDGLGYKIDGVKASKVKTFGNSLPAIPDGAKLYVYTGDEKGYKERTIDEFTNKNLEEFFGKQSSVPKEDTQTSLTDFFFPKVSAHAGHDDHAATPAKDGELSEERLTEINNLLGNVVIFAQKDKPTDAQVKERFGKLEPLSDSGCGG